MNINISQHLDRGWLMVLLLFATSILLSPVQADVYQPLYSNTDSEDIVTLQSDIPIRLVPDIDGDGRTETLTIDESSTCKVSVIHRSTALSDGAMTTSDRAGQLRLFDSSDECARFGRTKVIGDINGDGRRDLMYSHRQDLEYSYAAVVFTPASAGDIDVSKLDGRNGFLLEGEFFLNDAGDVDGDGFDDFIVGGDYYGGDRVYAGAAEFAATYAQGTGPGRTLVESTLGGGGFKQLGDLNGDGYTDLLLGRINTLNEYYILYGAASIAKSIENFADLDSDGGTFMAQCANSFGCSIEPVGDFDGDGYDDLGISFFGCGYANEAAVIYGAASGVPLKASLGDYENGEITRFSDNISSGCLSGVIGNSPGDLDADGLTDIFIQHLDGPSTAGIVFGMDGDRPAFLSMDSLDGASGVRFLLPDAFRYGYLTRPSEGMDVNGDGYDDLIDADGKDIYIVYETDEYLPFEPRAYRYFLRGKPRQLDSNGPANVVAEQVDNGWHVRWQPPEAADPAGYRVLLDGATLTDTDTKDPQFVVPFDSVDTPFRIDIEAIASDGSIIGSTVRQIADRIQGEQLTGTVYGPTLIELVFNRQEPWLNRSMTYQIWRNCDFLQLAQENADGFWDSTAQPGQSYTYYLTPVYSRFHDVSSQGALAGYPPLQRRSNSITVVTPGADGNVDPVPLPCLYGTVIDDGGSGGNGDSGDNGDVGSDSVSVDGNTIKWPEDGWYQVQDAMTFESLCEGGLSCTVPDGIYIVINHHTGQRWENVQVPQQPATNTVYVEGYTIHWPDDGWYQVQDASTYASLCESGRSCTVPDGIYIVINHDTGQRWEYVQVPEALANDKLYVEGQTIYFPNDGWYQVQDANTYESLCEGGSSCVVPDGRYIVINHTTGVRYEDIEVKGSKAEPPLDDSQGGTFSPTDIRVEF